MYFTAGYKTQELDPQNIFGALTTPKSYWFLRKKNLKTTYNLIL